MAFSPCTHGSCEGHAIGIRLYSEDFDERPDCHEECAEEESAERDEELDDAFPCVTGEKVVDAKAAEEQPEHHIEHAAGGLMAAGLGG